jgi:hypothetical protein
VELISLGLGAVARLAPEVLKALDRKNERKHELDMLREQTKLDQLRSDMKLREQSAANDAALSAAEMQAFIEAVKGQGQVTGVPRIDALNASVRPVLTYWWCLVLYTAVLAAKFTALMQAGVSPVEAILSLWGPAEQGIVGVMIGFWFVDRSIRHQRP